MNRPKIICHILQSVDGNIDGDFFSMPELRPAFQAFARIRQEYACDAVISGATTASEIYANSLAYDLPETKEPYPRTDWQAAKRTNTLSLLTVRARSIGKAAWWNGGAIKCTLSPFAGEYQRRLYRSSSSGRRILCFAGKDSLDLPLAVQKLKEKFGIEKILLSGGGIVDWTFLQAGLIDEISLVIPPVIDGGTGLASAFDDSVFAANHSSKSLSLIDVQRLDGDCIWLRYQTI